MKASSSAKLHFIFLFLLIQFSFTYGQISIEGTPASTIYHLKSDGLPQISYQLNPTQAEKHNALLGAYEPGQALFAGMAIEAPLNPAQSGKWEVVNGNLHVWRQIIHVPGALGLGLNFDAFEFSEKASLFVYNPGKSIVLGAFGQNNNNDEQIFSTQVIPGETVIIEYQEPYYPGKPERNEFSLLRLESLIYLSYGGGIDTFGQDEKNLGSSGACNVNINCSEGDNWQNHKRGIARMLMRVGDSYFWCTGTLINNTAQDASPVFLSAAHCGTNASARDMMYWQFYFNFERPECANQGTPPQHLIVGADLLSLGPLAGGSDFRLLMLRQDPPAHWRPYWNGWDRTNTTSFSGVGIHHPSGDAKKISTYNVQLTSSNPLVSGQQMAANSAWRVTWSPTTNGHGVVQGGSSGSPIFNSNGLVTGTLTGGSSSCDNPFSPDYYGKMWYHWDKNGSANIYRVAPFLDPLNTGQEQLQGYDPYEVPLPPPGFIMAKLAGSQAQLQWYKPGSAPNPEGWFSYVQQFSHLTWSAPERAVVFDANLLGLNYPITLSKVSHMFVQHASQPWPNNQFTFKIYASNGRTLLYESPSLTAVSQQVIEHVLNEPLVLNNYFYVAVRPVDASGHPSSLMRHVNFGQGYSFFGAMDNWTAHNVNNMGGSYTYLTRIFVEASKGNGLAGKNSAGSSEFVSATADFGAEPGTELELFANAAPPSGYKVYLNGNLIHTNNNSDQLTHNDNSPAEGLSSYYVTANYNGGESDPSPKAYLLNTAPCGETISQFPYSQVFNNSFDSQCWLDYGVGEWDLGASVQVNETTINPSEGNQFYSIKTNAGSESDQWLILPLADFGSMANPAIRFMFNGIYDNEKPVLAVWVSKNGESFKKVWHSGMHPSFATGAVNLQWISATVNLKQAGNHNDARIAFQYEGTGEGFFAIDKIELINAATITYNVNVTVNPDYSGTISGAGSHLGGQTVNLKATPNLGYVFSGWVQGANVLSTNADYSFVMPAGNVNLTASFVSDPTSVTIVADERPALELFPNPARDFIRIRFNEGLSSATVSLFNSQAQLVAQKAMAFIQPGDEQQLSTSGLPKGVYFVQIKTTDSVRVLKILLTD